ncbi:sulfite exporter TauE/SafE family protein [Echinimonas agarilytica]|uniref:Probable membrane transporter protein n=1 Tax=Echinimonas agarilytica TaxID=1215918 RepID=A0AA41W7N0_9GAMM|nr:sulfite exporter TauE/SafE family protein [Echinimonas agarilytica]MCM2680236.1 sulfite exporter TauE/SafE family protein [Echinimonas agarilytica]
MEQNLADIIQAWLPIAAAMIGTGVVAGILAGLLGVGGGIVIVPVFYFVLQSIGVPQATAILVATGTSLLVIIPTSLSSIRAHHQRGNIDWPLIKRWAPAMIIGVIAGSQTALLVDGAWVSGLFGIIAILVAMNMLFRAKAAPLAHQLPPMAGQRVMATCIGFFSVMIGIGGGTLGVPTLTSCNYPSHRAVGTAAVFGLLISIPGAITMLLAHTPATAPDGMVGLVNIPGALAIMPLTILLAPFGAWIGSKLDAVLLKKLFAVFLCISGGRMLMQLLGA